MGIRQAEKKDNNWVKEEGVIIEYKYHVGIVYILSFKHLVEHLKPLN